MGVRPAAVVAGLALGLGSGAANAAYMFDFSETSSGVFETGSGSLDLSGLVFSNDTPDVAATQPNRPRNAIGASATVSIYEANFFSNNPFGTNSTVNATSGSGSFVSLAPDIYTHAFEVPSGYLSGTQLGNSTAFYAGYTFATLGLTPGSYTYNYETSNGRDSFTVNVTLSSVPLPASAPMFGAALLGLAGLSYRAKRKKGVATA